MGWGTTFTADIFFSKEHIDNLYQLESKIEDAERDIRTCRERILMHCAAGVNAAPKYDCEENVIDSPLMCIHNEVNELFDWYEEAVTTRYKLNLLKDDWDDKDNKFKTAFTD
jgi:hypothetical protein